MPGGLPCPARCEMQLEFRKRKPFVTASPTRVAPASFPYAHNTSAYMRLPCRKDGTLTVQSAGTDVPAKVLKTLYIGKSVVYMIDAVLYPSGEVFAPPAPPRPPLSAPAMAKPSLPILLGSALLTLLAPAVLSRLLSKLQ